MARPSVEAERRDQILVAACEVIADRGVRAMRVADVARVAGLSPGIIHYYFDNKQNLTRAAFEHNFAHSLRRRAGILQSPGDPVARLRRLVEAYLPKGRETVLAWRVWIELWAAALQDQDLRGLNDRAYGAWRGIVAGLIREGQASGQLEPGDSVAMANQLVGLLDGLALQVLLGSRGMTISRMRATCHALVDRFLIGGADA